MLSIGPGTPRSSGGYSVETRRVYFTFKSSPERNSPGRPGTNPAGCGSEVATYFKSAFEQSRLVDSAKVSLKCLDQETQCNDPSQSGLNLDCLVSRPVG